jgi:23S rRNA pseudouridine2605 synthase
MVRLNKFLAERLGISRREADDLIAEKQIQVNGKVAILGKTIDFSDEVCYNGGIVPHESALVYVALNKPRGYVSSRRAQGEAPTLYELLPEEYRALKTVGRLDKESSGLILLTNDGDFAFQMTHPSFKKVKIYEVELDKALAPLHQQMVADFGVELADGRSRLGLTDMGGRKKWRVEMSEGKNRQIRRTFGALGYTVIDLCRVQFGKYVIGELKSGAIERVSP